MRNKFWFFIVIEIICLSVFIPVIFTTKNTEQIVSIVMLGLTELELILIFYLREKNGGRNTHVDN